MTLFGKGNPVLESFGLTKGTRKTPTRSAGGGKGTAKLTRTARNTMGSVQKAKVKGGTATLALTGPAGQLLEGSAPTAAAPVPAASGSGTGNSGNGNGQ